MGLTLDCRSTKLHLFWCLKQIKILLSWYSVLSNSNSEVRAIEEVVGETVGNDKRVGVGNDLGTIGLQWRF